jgi:hypothetical protein
MLYELRTYTLQPGKLPEYLGYHTTIGRPIRGDDYGRLVGNWTTEIGPLNQYVHLWEYDSAAERERLRGELAKNQRWATEYVPKIRSLMVKQESKIMALAPGCAIQRPSGGPHIYELRSYRTIAGKTGEWLSLFMGAMPIRQKYSPLVGAWSVDVGVVQDVLHIWVDDDLNHRASVRAAAMADPDWQAFVPKSSALLAEMSNTILVPTKTSPLQ